MAIVPLLLLLFACKGLTQDAAFHSQVTTWAEIFGGELWEVTRYASKKEQVQEEYNRMKARVEVKDGNKLIKEIAEDIKDLVDLKISAVKRIMDTAENTAWSHQDEEVPKYFKYYNAKHLNKSEEDEEEEEEAEEDEDEEDPKIYRYLHATAQPNAHFYNMSVNTSISSVHVPTNVYDQAPEVLKGIRWSEKLDIIFRHNYEMDPSLSWQYFGSSTGFMRQYPAMQWLAKVDLYDCRTRSWYIEAATSPKDMVILIDTSGSMTGMRKEIAKHVVNNILDTLGNNDFVNIFNFSDTTDNVVECYDQNTLVQANLENVRALKNSIEDMDTDGIANFTEALTKAFEVLESYREDPSRGAGCNQAIMLVTDGVPYNFKEIFELYNWENLPYMPVRVFTYLIGREVADIREVKWMACANQGYYVHLSTLAEVREQVLHYVPVMARPLVLNKTFHPVIWTPVYADITDPKMTDWYWEDLQREYQKERALLYKGDRNTYIETEHLLGQKLGTKLEDGEPVAYQLMTSISMPVYDRRENASRIANLLGVAGTDVPVQDIQKLTAPHKLGVHGYAFLVTNNGYILIHPDLRPTFQGILKPNYNSVDLSEVEFLDDEREARDYSPELIALRENVLDRKSGMAEMTVKHHYDDMKRVSIIRRKYYYQPISDTPFTLGISIPQNFSIYEVHGEKEVSLTCRKEGSYCLSFFNDSNWKVHPDWYYCKYHYDTEHPFASPEAEIREFLDKALKRFWKWPSDRFPYSPERKTELNMTSDYKPDKNNYFCDRDLFLSLLFDAEVTKDFSDNKSMAVKEDQREELWKMFGLKLAFIATRSGLTRWLDYYTFPDIEEEESEPHFSQIHTRAIDEVWYKRAVEHNKFHNQSFVFAVPFDAGSRSNSLVTASQAIYISDGNKAAPAAVVGVQLQHSALVSKFLHITSKCATCERNCSSEELECYVIDNNGYIIISEDHTDTGKFFGEVQGSVMESMTEKNLFRKVIVYDYQSVCFERTSSINDACTFSKPIHYFQWLVKWIFGKVLWVLIQTNLHHLIYGDWTFANEDDIYDTPDRIYDDKLTTTRIDPSVPINRTRPQPCDKIAELYQYQKSERSEPTHHRKKQHSMKSEASDPCWNYIMEDIPHSNLLLVVVNRECVADRGAVLSVTPEEIYYNGTLSCYKQNSLYVSRKRLPDCINKHEKEQDIKDLCGGKGKIQLSLMNLALCWLLIILFKLPQEDGS